MKEMEALAAGELGAKQITLNTFVRSPLPPFRLLPLPLYRSYVLSANMQSSLALSSLFSPPSPSYTDSPSLAGRRIRLKSSLVGEVRLLCWQYWTTE
jgi:hypothetical protein